MFVADGNFKADHVRQKGAEDDIWLSEGAGMIPKREEYHTFLKSAIERQTVSCVPDAEIFINIVIGICLLESTVSK